MTKRSPNPEHYFVASPSSEPKYGLIHARLRGKSFQFLTASGVFSKRRVDLGSTLLIETMDLPKKGNILDVGCGYGAVGIVAAASNSRLHVVLTEVNRRAVYLAKQNIKMNKVHNAEVKRGHLYEPVEDLRFNCILSNPPVSAGMETVKAIIQGAPNLMVNQATFQMVIRSKIGAKTFPPILEKAFGNFSVLGRGSGYRILKAEKRD